MRLASPGVLVAFLIVLCGVAALPARPANALPGQNIASDTYYRIDVQAGVVSARVEAEVQGSGYGDLTEVILWAMPTATGVQVTRDGQPLSIETVHPVGPDLPMVVVVTLDKPLKGKLTADLLMTYTVPTGQTMLTEVEPGYVESMFVSQGAGSFVLLELPAGAENTLDPGCVVAARQPEEVKSAGYERWVCGEVLAAAFNTDNQSALDKCANMDDRCRQRFYDIPFSAFAQSITNQDLLSYLDATVALSNKSVELRFRYFKVEEEWARRQFDLAYRVAPRIEALFGFPYGGDELILRQSNYIGFAGAAGVAFPTEGEMFLLAGTGFDEEVTIHELSHQWAGTQFEAPWLWEGLAEWSTRILGPEFGIPIISYEDWRNLGYPNEPLATWYNGSLIRDPAYWYSKAGDFWFAYESAVGGRENMTQILSRVDDDPTQLPVDGRWFMDVGELVTGANLDSLFVEWVWTPEYATSTIAERRATWDRVHAMRAEAAAVGLSGVPSDIWTSLRAWNFTGADAKIADAREVIADYRTLLEEQTAHGLTPTTAVQQSWETSTVQASANLVASHRQAIRSIASATSDLAEEPPESAAQVMLTDARDAYNRGQLAEAKQLAADAQVTVHNAAASVTMLEIARNERERFNANFFTRIGLLWSDPDAKLAKAEAALEAGDHTTALRLSRSAFETWNGAQSRGFQRLAIVAGVLCALSVATWFGLRKIDRQAAAAGKRTIHDGHRIDASERKSRWQDWENTP